MDVRKGSWEGQRGVSGWKSCEKQWWLTSVWKVVFKCLEFNNKHRWHFYVNYSWVGVKSVTYGLKMLFTGEKGSSKDWPVKRRTSRAVRCVWCMCVSREGAYTHCWILDTQCNIRPTLSHVGVVLQAAAPHSSIPAAVVHPFIPSPLPKNTLLLPLRKIPVPWPGSNTHRHAGGLPPLLHGNYVSVIKWMKHTFLESSAAQEVTWVKTLSSERKLLHVFQHLQPAGGHSFQGWLSEMVR